MQVSPGPSTGERNVFVLSGGAARGAVQVGMLEVLLERGILPHALVGSSVGALNAAFVGHRTGGLAMVAVIAAMIFAAVSGSAPATTAAIGSP